MRLLARVGYRYRSELAPVVVCAALALTGTILHRHQVRPLWIILAALVAVGTLCWPRAALRPIERGYAVAIVLACQSWLITAAALGPRTPPLPLLLAVGSVVCALPWWAHRRRRAKVRVERALAAWPDLAAAVGLAGSRVMSAKVDQWGWRARIALPRGGTTADLVNSAARLESGLHTRPGAVRVEPDPTRADHALIRVLTADPHARPIPCPAPATEAASILEPIPLGLFEDGEPVTARLAYRHGLIGGMSGAGKSGALNAVLAGLVACSDVALWGIDLKGGMELAPWAGCLDRLATTPGEATALLADAVAELEARTRQLAGRSRLWMPTPTAPALIIVIDEYAELVDKLGHADSVARRGRAVAVNLLAATQRPTQKAMDSDVVRAQMDVRICLRVRERRDVDLILGQGMLAAGWAAHTLDAPGKFLISTPEHTAPRRARAYHLTDREVAAIAARHQLSRPATPELVTTHWSPSEIDPPTVPIRPANVDADDPVAALWATLEQAPENGCSVRELTDALGMSRSWVYLRLQEYAAAGRVAQLSRGRWVGTGSRR